MIILNEQEMWRCVSLDEIMGGIERAYEIHRAGNYVMPDRYVAGRDGNLMLYMPCFIDGAVGTKMLAEFPGNPAKGLPYLSGLMIVNDGETGTTNRITKFLPPVAQTEPAAPAAPAAQQLSWQKGAF